MLYNKHRALFWGPQGGRHEKALTNHLPWECFFLQGTFQLQPDRVISKHYERNYFKQVSADKNISHFHDSLL